ncbi:hypothetical protein QUF76_17550 [Desulfobacterales bacterium HSG16]|nr:hypothetical protein [Desulfobacterales bacterium HSG16]
MKSVRNIVIGLILFPFLIYFVLYIIALTNGDFTLDEMDIDNDGFVSPTEAGYFDDSGTRDIEVDGKKCVDYFAFKDGLSLKVTCEE